MFKFFVLFVIFCPSLISAQNRTQRIVGGRDVLLGEIPFQVSLRRWGSDFHFCGGALISSKWILTTGNCVYQRPRNSINIVAGIVSLHSRNGISRRSYEIIVHPRFNYYIHDIALVCSAIPFPITRNIQPIFISPFMVRDAVSAQVSGFGARNQDGGHNSERLQSLNVFTMEIENCAEIYQTTDMTSNMCTRNAIGEGFCTTDLGSPLVSNAQLIGLASWNVPCALGFPDLYVRISPYRSWIGGMSGV